MYVGVGVNVQCKRATVAPDCCVLNGSERMRQMKGQVMYGIHLHMYIEKDTRSININTGIGLGMRLTILTNTCTGIQHQT